MGPKGPLGEAVFGSSPSSTSLAVPAYQAGQATIKGAEIAAQSQREALDYLKERERLPRQFSEEALTGLAGIYGLEGGEGSQQELIDRSIASPLYQATMGGQEFGEEAIMRQASATGGLRSGNVQDAMYDYNTQLQNQALLQAYNQQLGGLQGMAGLPSYAPQIAQGMAGIGQTLGQGVAQAGQTTAMGQMGAMQFQQTSQQNMLNNLLGLSELGVGAYGAGMFSDRRLKKNIKKIGNIKGFNWYSFDWNSIAEKLGMKGTTRGCMADEVYNKNPEAITIRNNFMYVLYSKIGILKSLEAHNV